MASRPSTPDVAAFWADFRAASDIGHDRFDVVAMGDGPAMATELAELILAGQKRATVSLARDYADGALAHPAVGDHVVVVDGGGAPHCIWRTTEITVKPLDHVDAQFAWDEGEGDRTLRWWLDAHCRYYARLAARDGFVFAPSDPAVFERFTVVWPPSAADRPVPR